MERLFYFFYQYRAFFTFLILEVFCVWLIVQNNQYHNTKFFNSSSSISASLLTLTHDVGEYFSLRRINTELAEENADLRTRLEQRNQVLGLLELPRLNDSTLVNRFEFAHAKVVNNSTGLTKNHITVNQGALVGIEPGMAAIGPSGIIGKVKSVSRHYATLISVLNTDEMISSAIKRSGNFGSIQWNGVDPRYVNLLYIPRHADPQVGDTVVTSGYNAIFPESVLVGVIRGVELGEEAPFYSIVVELGQDFSKLAYVYIIKSELVYEKDSLESITLEGNN